MLLIYDPDRSGGKVTFKGILEENRDALPRVNFFFFLFFFFFLRMCFSAAVETGLRAVCTGHLGGRPEVDLEYHFRISLLPQPVDWHSSVFSSRGLHADKRTFDYRRGDTFIEAECLP